MTIQTELETMATIVDHLERALALADRISVNIVAAKISDALDTAREGMEIQRRAGNSRTRGFGNISREP
jgi:hypothetical protein